MTGIPLASGPSTAQEDAARTAFTRESLAAWHVGYYDQLELDAVRNEWVRRTLNHLVARDEYRVDDVARRRRASELLAQGVEAAFRQTPGGRLWLAGNYGPNAVLVHAHMNGDDA